MSLINKSNIVAFIAQLYRERKGSEAPPELLQRWRNLSEDEIQRNLVGLFESWGMGATERQRAMERFVGKNQPPPVSAPRPSVSQQYTPAPKQKSKTWLWIVLGLIALVAGYFGYQYIQFVSMTRIYAITENIAVRDHQGKMSARMDLYPKEGTTEKSYSSLRVVDNEVYYKQPEGSDKEYPTRMVILDDASFKDYIFKRDEMVHFVNINYIVNDKKEFELYKSAFKDIQSVSSDNAKMIAVYRKIIVGSMVQNDDLANNFILTRNKGLSSSLVKGTESFIVREVKKGSAYGIIASLDNGVYYQFQGDINANQFQSPTIVQLQSVDGQQGNLTGNFRFVKSGNDWKLFDIDEKKVSSYYLDKKIEPALFYYKITEPTEEEKAQQAQEINEAYQNSNDPIQPDESTRPVPASPATE